MSLEQSRSNRRIGLQVEDLGGMRSESVGDT